MFSDLDYPPAQPAEVFDFWYIQYAQGDGRATTMVDRPEVTNSFRLGEHRHEH